MMRVVREFYGIILIDGSEITLRVYKIEGNNWQLIHYNSRDLVDKKLESGISAYTIAEVIADFFAKTLTQEVVECQICARNVTKQTAVDIAQAIGLKVEYLERVREQELLCKGLFTEVW